MPGSPAGIPRTARVGLLPPLTLIALISQRNPSRGILPDTTCSERHKLHQNDWASIGISRQTPFPCVLMPSNPPRRPSRRPALLTLHHTSEELLSATQNGKLSQSRLVPLIIVLTLTRTPARISMKECGIAQLKSAQKFTVKRLCCGKIAPHIFRVLGLKVGPP